MNKIKNKFFKAFLSLGLLAAFSFATFAQAKNEKVASYLAHFKYDNKDMEKTFDDNKPVEFQNKKNRIYNKTSAKEYVNFYAVMQKMLEKYNIPRKKLSKGFDFCGPESEKLQMLGEIHIVAEDLKQEKNFENLIKNFNSDVKNIKITQADFEKAKDEIVQAMEDKIEKHRKLLENNKSNPKINEMHSNYKKYKDYDNTTEGLTKFGRFLSKKIIENLEKELKETSNATEIKNIKKNIKSQKEFLNDDKKAFNRGKIVYVTQKYTDELIPFLQSHIKQVKDVKYDDIKNLTKDLKVNENKLSKVKMSRKEAY